MPAADTRNRGVGLLVVVGVLLLPLVLKFVWSPLAILVEYTLVLVVMAGIWRNGPSVGFHKRAAIIVTIPVIGIFVFIPALWRWGCGRRWLPGEPLEPAWSPTSWNVGTFFGTAGLALVVAEVIASIVKVA